jgi:predicted transcriptional regulator
MDADHKKIYQMISGYARTSELFTIVKLGIPDILANEPKTLQEIANELNIDKNVINRFLRLLISREFISLNDSKFSLTSLGDILRADHPDSLRNLILYVGEVQYLVGHEMEYSIRTEKPAFNKIFGMGFFEYLSMKPEMSSYFNEAMNQQASIRTAGLINSYDFRQTRSILDIGGGDATLISAILMNNQQIKGIVFEVATVVEETRRNLTKNNLIDRCDVVRGDFFEDAIPPGADIYILSNIIHDWGDTEARKILQNCSKSMDDNSKLLIIEQLIPEQVTPGSSAVGSDISMLVLTGGRERTLSEYKKLFLESNLVISRVIPLALSNIPEGRKPDWAIIECELL